MAGMHQQVSPFSPSKDILSTRGKGFFWAQAIQARFPQFYTVKYQIEPILTNNIYWIIKKKKLISFSPISVHSFPIYLGVQKSTSSDETPKRT